MPSAVDLEGPLKNIGIAIVVSIAGAAAIARFLPSIPIYRRMMTTGVSGESGIVQLVSEQERLVGLEGVAVSVLRPGGKIRVGDKFYDAVSRGELVASGRRVRVVAFSGRDCVVEVVADQG
jgi:membrane-bound serine protease (ClpP class)